MGGKGPAAVSSPMEAKGYNQPEYDLMRRKLDELISKTEKFFFKVQFERENEVIFQGKLKAWLWIL